VIPRTVLIQHLEEINSFLDRLRILAITVPILLRRAIETDFVMSKLFNEKSFPPPPQLPFPQTRPNFLPTTRIFAEKL